MCPSAGLASAASKSLSQGAEPSSRLHGEGPAEAITEQPGWDGRATGSHQAGLQASASSWKAQVSTRFQAKVSPFHLLSPLQTYTHAYQLLWCMKPSGHF